MNDAVFRAILAMDSYKRGYAPALNLILNQSKLGQATLTGDSGFFGFENGSRVAETYGFYASSYRWTDSRNVTHDVISFRGTNPDFNSDIRQFLDSPVLKDAWNGWRLAIFERSLLGAEAGLWQQRSRG